LNRWRDHANTLYYREADGGIVIVSEPFDCDENPKIMLSSLKLANEHA